MSLTGQSHGAALSIVETQRLVSAGELTVRALVEAVLERCAELDPALGAYVHLDEEGARAQADALDRRRSRGTPPSPLHGVPLAVKDMIDVAGFPTRAGSRVLTNAPAALEDAPVVAALRRSGALVTGKTSTHEFAMGTVTPQARNPHRSDRIAGGSSGGSAVAVAAGLAGAALGTDTGGSIRIPAALCGVVGLKPRPGLLDAGGVIPLSPIADVTGPLTRTIEDARILWRSVSATAATGRRIRRVGVPIRSALGELEPAVEEAHLASQRRLAVRGLDVVPVAVPDFEAWYPVRLVPLYAAASRIHRSRGWFPQRRGAYSAGLRSVLDAGADHTASDILNAWAELTSLSSRLLEAMDDVDALLLPTTPITAPLSAPDVDEAARKGLTDVSRTLTRLCAPFNWVPLAAVSVPAGFSVDGLPIGMQLVARDEMTALNAAACIESHD